MANTVEFCGVVCIKSLRVSSEHLNYKEHSIVRAAYRFHVYYHVRRILKRLQVPLPHEAYWTYQHGVGWPNDYIGPDLMTHRIIENSKGFTDVRLLRISESVRAYAYLILSCKPLRDLV